MRHSPAMLPLNAAMFCTAQSPPSSSVCTVEVSFRELVEGQEVYNVCRIFAATLQLVCGLIALCHYHTRTHTHTHTHTQHTARTCTDACTLTQQWKSSRMPHLAATNQLALLINTSSGALPCWRMWWQCYSTQCCCCGRHNREGSL